MRPDEELKPTAQGSEKGLIRIDSEWLVVAFGADDRVSAARLVRD